MPRLNGFVGPSNTSYSRAAAADRTVNLIVEKIDPATGKNAFVLYGRPGLQRWASAPAPAVQGFLITGEPYTVYQSTPTALPKLYIVANWILYDVSLNGLTWTPVGDVAHDDIWGVTPVQMFNMGTSPDQIMCVGGGKATVFVIGGASINFAAVSGCFFGGSFLATVPDTRQVQYSALLDGLNWTPPNGGTLTKEEYPDRVVGILANHEELWLFGSETAEVWANVGNPDTPYQLIPDGLLHQGGASAWGAAAVGGIPHWVGLDSRGNLMAFRANGFQPVPVSTPSVVERWKSYEFLPIFTHTYRENAHDVWVINFGNRSAPVATWTYDATTGSWGERTSALIAGGFADVPFCHVYSRSLGKHLVGDGITNHIYEASTAFYDDAGTPITYVRTAPHLFSENLRSSIHRFEVEMETGTRPTGGAVMDPVATLTVSKNRGQSFGNARQRTLGLTGDYTKRVYWNRLGAARDWVLSLSITAQSKIALIDAFLEASMEKRLVVA